MQNIANQLLDAFPDVSRVIKSHAPTTTAPIRINVPVGQFISTNEIKPCLKCDRPIGLKNKNPRKSKGANDQDGHNIEVSTKKES